MIGQQKLLDKVNKWTEVPRFLIFNGEKGCGKKTLAKEIAKKFNMQLIYVGIKIDEIRNMIKLANEVDTDIIFLIDEGNKMSLGAENTLLKITEEAPNNTHIILAVENKELLLPTINSRGEILTFQSYSLASYMAFMLANNIEVPDKLPVMSIYPNLSYFEVLPINEASDFYDYCDKVVTKIRTANVANCFKILEKIKIKDDQTGWNLYQFLFCVKNICSKNLKDAAITNNKDEYYYMLEFIKIITNTQRLLVNSLFNKLYIFDNLIIDLKSIGR